MLSKHKITNFIKIFTLVIFFNSLQAQSEPLKVGTIIPLSGMAAEYGSALRNGVQLAQSEFEEVDRSSINFIFEDSAYDN